jgi:C-terminal processing protease CtpA/Prc
VPNHPKEEGYTATVVTENPKGGRQAALLAFEGDRQGDQVFGTVMTSFDAAPYRGKRIRFRAAVRVEVPTSQDKVGLWLRVDREGGARGFFDNMGNRPITSPAWKTYEIVGEVAPDAKSVHLGLLLSGSGKAWIDSASVETLDASPATPAVGIEPARPLTDRGLENLVAFTRLLGYVRFFHPSDQAAAADWDRLAIASVQVAEKAASPEELARSLEAFFRPVAPTVRVYPTAGPKPAPPSLEGAEAVYWEHVGVKLGDQPSVYSSKRISTRQGAPAGGGGAIQYLETAAFKGKRVVVRAAARAEVQGPHKAELRVRPYRWDGAPLPEQTVAVTSSDWRVYETAIDVPKEADGLAVGLVLASEGRVWWDDVSLDISPESGGAPGVKNGGFEEGEGLSDWAVSRTDKRAGYQALSTEERPRNGRRSLLVSWTKPESTGAPRPGETFAADLGGGVSAVTPLAVYKDAQGTLPRVSPEVKPPAPGKPEGFVPTGDDRTTRLAGVALAWSVFQHFYPYFDVVEADWPAELRKALTRAATDADGQAFVFTLRRLMTALHDGHGNAYKANQDMSAFGLLPVLWDWVEDQLVITEVASGTEIIRRGDVVLSIDGKPAREAIAAQKEMAPGATDAWRTWRTLRRMLLGKRDEPVRLEGKHPDGEAFTVTLKRSLSAEVPVLEETRPEKIAEVRPGIFYVDISRIEDADFNAALDRLAAAKGIVFDLRGYPNGSTVIISHLTDKPVSSARWTVPVITRPDRQGWIWDVSSWDVQPRQPRLKGKTVFMTDGRAISYAETYMGIIAHYKLAEIVGAPTAGTNGNVNPFTLPGGYTLPWTGMRVLKHDGSQHHGIGILPTIPASRTLKGVAEGRDEVLEKAIEVVSP